ncbi:MAG: M24 family metallopeptidase, partial [Candidatus Hodarchaeales archaeon]
MKIASLTKFKNPKITQIGITMEKLKILGFTQIMLFIFLSFTIPLTTGTKNKSIDCRVSSNSLFIDAPDLLLVNGGEDLATAADLSVLMHTEAQKILSRAYETEITQQDLITQVNALSRVKGGDNALSFPTIVYSGSDFDYLHGNPYDDNSHVIDPSSEPLVMIDLGAQYNGMCSDVTRTYFFENASEKMKLAYEVVVAVELAVIEAIKPGVKLGDLNDIFWETYNQSGFTMEGSYIYPYWGHGVKYHVHESPTLGYPAYENFTITLGDALAIEPSYYNLVEGWSVRVEDTILVTDNGNIILSDSLPRQLKDVIIPSALTREKIKISINDYEYHKMATIAISSQDFSDILSMEFYDGYNWHPLRKINESSYEVNYSIEMYYSSTLLGLLKITATNGQTSYISKELLLTPHGTTTNYSGIQIRASSDLYENTSYGGIYDLTTQEWEDNYKYSWIFSASEVDLIRIHFNNANFNPEDSFLLLDENNSVMEEFFVFQNTSTSMDAFWSPWIGGSKIIVALEALSGRGFHNYSFIIDQVETIILYPPEITSSLTTTRSSIDTSRIIGGV